jgi:hypothetical protein
MALIAIVVFTQRTFRNSDELLNEVHRRQTADLPSANYLFLRFSGDEAAAALSAAQFIAWLSVKLSQAFEFLTRPLFRSRTIVRILVGGLSGGAVSLAALSTLGIADETVHSFRAAAQGDIVVTLAFYFYYFCVIILPYLLAFAVLAAFSIFLAQALTSWAFGWMEFSTGFYVELAIEPLPFGAHSMAHIDWSADAVGLEGITHPNCATCLSDLNASSVTSRTSSSLSKTGSFGFSNRVLPNAHHVPHCASRSISYTKGS